MVCRYKIIMYLYLNDNDQYFEVYNHYSKYNGKKIVQSNYSNNIKHALNRHCSLIYYTNYIFIFCLQVCAVYELLKKYSSVGKYSQKSFEKRTYI